MSEFYSYNNSRDSVLQFFITVKKSFLFFSFVVYHFLFFFASKISSKLDQQLGKTGVTSKKKKRKVKEKSFKLKNIPVFKTFPSNVQEMDLINLQVFTLAQERKHYIERIEDTVSSYDQMMIVTNRETNKAQIISVAEYLFTFGLKI